MYKIARLKLPPSEVYLHAPIRFCLAIFTKLQQLLGRSYTTMLYQAN